MPEPLYDIVITGATVLTGAADAAPLHDAIIGISNGRFALIEEASTDKAPAAARRISALWARGRGS
jgi:5-methylthioadenosine/S-adenosylhomocysteine deaminase